MFFSLLILSLPFNVYANKTPTIPAEMRAKWDDVSRSMMEGYQDAKVKLNEVANEQSALPVRAKIQKAKDSNFGQALSAAAERVWAMAKKKGRSALVVLDRKLHEKVLGPAEHP